MKLGIFDALRRGFDNTISNWQLAVIRWLEVLVFAAIAIGAVIAILVPVLISIGIHFSDFMDPNDLPTLAETLLQRWVIFLWIFVAVFVMLTIFAAIHSFVEAGVARVLVDAERIAGPLLNEPRARYRVYSTDKWMAGGRDGWWDVFLIYMAVWGFGGLLMLIPLAPLVILMWIFRSSEGPFIAVTCLGLLFFVLVAFVISIAMGLWSNRAIVQWALDRKGVSDALSHASAAVKSDFARHLFIMLIVMVVAVFGSSFLSSFSLFASLGEQMTDNNEIFMFMTLPIRFFFTIVGWAFSALVTNWYMASYAALAVEGRR